VAITAGFGGSSKMTEVKKSVADLVSDIVERLRAGSVETEGARHLAGVAAKLLGGRPPAPELVEGLVRGGMTVAEIEGVLGPFWMPEEPIKIVRADPSFTPEQWAEYNRIMEAQRAKEVNRQETGAPKAQTEEERLKEKAEKDLAKWPSGRRVTNDGPSLVPEEIDAVSMERLTYVPGLVRDLVEWNVRTARYPSRVMALTAAIAVVGKFLDRKVAGPTMSGTHLYTIVLAPTGSGKRHQLEIVKTALTTAGMADVIGPGDFSSVQALQQLIKEKNSCIAVMDEFGSFLRRIKDGAQMSNIREITGEMRTLWDSWIRYDSVKKAREESVTVYSPAFSIFAVTTAGDFYSALKIEDASNGFLNRFLILEEKSRVSEREPGHWIGDVPFALMDKLQKTVARYQAAGVKALLDRSGPLKPQSKLGWGPGADELYREFSKSIRLESDESVLELRVRAPEMAVRLATIRAAGRWSATVDEDDIKWGIELAQASADMLCAGVAEHMVPEGLDGLCEKIIEVVQRNKGVCSVRDVYRSVRRRIKRSGDLEAALAYLEKEERIEREKPSDARFGPVIRVLKD
jgi:hypothetical protein